MIKNRIIESSSIVQNLITVFTQDEKLVLSANSLYQICMLLFGFNYCFKVIGYHQSKRRSAENH